MANENMWPWKGRIKDVKIALRRAAQKPKNAALLKLQIADAEKGLVGITPYSEQINDLTPEWVQTIAAIDALKKQLDQLNNGR